MYALVIYNPNSANEVNSLARIQDELSSYLIESQVVSIEAAKLKYPVRATPCLIIIRDDLQGDALLTEDVESGKLNIVANAYKNLQEEERVIHNLETQRLDNLINAEKTKAIDDYTLELVTGGMI